MKRIASLEPSVTATLIALGQREKLAAVTRYCPRLVDVGDLPQLEPTWSVNAGEIAALAPDLVIAGTPYRPGKIDELLQKQLNVLCLYPQTLADVYAQIKWLGRLCEVPERAEELVGQMDGELQKLRQRAAGKPRQRVYVEIWHSPLMNASGWIADIVTALGGEFVPRPAERQIEAGEVITANPEVIIMSWAGIAEMDPEDIRRRPGWDQISAVQSGRIVPVDEIALNAPGPNLVKGMHEVWHALYPGDPVEQPGRATGV